MNLTNTLFWEGMAFSGAAVGIIVLSAWWLYFSPLKDASGPVAAPSPRLAGWLAALLGLSAAQLVTGAFWDASMHILTGEIPAGADFLWPPHLMIYGAFLLSFAVSGMAIGLVTLSGWRTGQRDPRRWLRRNPYLGAVALASLYSLLAIPGDALWHALYGIDLTAWSPPHVFLGVTSCIVLISALGLLAQSRAAAARPGLHDAAALELLSLMLNVAYLIGVIEWELPGVHNPLVDARPIWLYPLVGGALAFFTLLLAKRLVAFRWAATVTAGGFYLLRLVITVGMSLTGNVAPFMPIWFMLGAILLDAIPWQRLPSAPLRDGAAAAAFTAGYALLALPLLRVRAGLPVFTPSDLFISITATLVVSLLALPVVHLTSARLLGGPLPSSTAHIHSFTAGQSHI